MTIATINSISENPCCLEVDGDEFGVIEGASQGITLREIGKSREEDKVLCATADTFLTPSDVDLVVRGGSVEIQDSISARDRTGMGSIPCGLDLAPARCIRYVAGVRPEAVHEIIGLNNGDRAVKTRAGILQGDNLERGYTQ